MKRALFYLIIAVVTSQPLCYAAHLYEKSSSSKAEVPQSSGTNNRTSEPSLGGLKLITELPAELPPRISDLAYDGEKIWAVIYHGRGRYATLDPSTLIWEVSDADDQHEVIRGVAGAFGSPGGVCFVNGELWIAGSSGESFGSIDTRTWKITSLFKGKYRDYPAYGSYSAMAFDGSHLWIVWHSSDHKLPTSQTQLLLKVEPETGKVIGEYPAPAGHPTDGAHGLTWDGTRLWHMKDSRLSSIDPSSGRVIDHYTLDQIKRPNGLAWDGKALWIAEFNGKVWRLPFEGGRGYPR